MKGLKSLVPSPWSLVLACCLLPVACCLPSCTTDAERTFVAEDVEGLGMYIARPSAQ